MRLRRTVLAGLAPLLGVSALMAIIAAGPQSPKQPGVQSKAQHPLVRLIHSVFQLVAPAAEAPSAHARARRPSPEAFLSTAALADTPLGHSLWMVTNPLVPPPNLRAQQRPQLRC